MRKMSGRAVILMACLWLSATAASAQVVKRRAADGAKPQQAGNAAPLFQLAIDELSPEVVRQIRGITKRSRGVARGVFVLGGAAVAADADDEDRLDPWSEPIAGTVLARSMFLQACAQDRCVFATVSPAAEAWRANRLDFLSLLVENDARLRLKTDAVVACESACALLRYLRFQSAATTWANLPKTLERERGVLKLLRQGLSELRRSGNQQAVSRFRDPLRAHEQNRFGRRILAEARVASVTELIELHTPRLRDVLARQPGGFDAVMMRDRLQKTLRAMLAADPGRPETFRQWMARLRQQRAELMPAPTEQSTVRYRVDYGMLRLVLVSFEDVARSTLLSEEALDQCAELLR